MMRLLPEQSSDKIRCAKCGEFKSPDSFNLDKNKVNGRTSYCKECNAKHAEEWRSNHSPVVYNIKEITELYTMAYKEGWDKSTNTTVTGKRREANTYATSVCPEGGKAMTYYAHAINNQAEKRNDELFALGSAVVHSLRSLGMSKKFKDNKSVQPSDPELPFYKLFEEWITFNDFIPTDDVFIFFGACTRSAIQSLRHRLRAKGFDFAECVNGWKVTKRPVVTMPSTSSLSDMSKDDLIAMIKKLV